MNHAGIAVEERRVASFAGGTDEQLEPYLSDLKVPILLDEDLIVWDSLSILEYLTDRHPEGNGWPVTGVPRRQPHRASAEMHSIFVALRNALPMNCRKRFNGFSISPEVKMDIEMVLALWRF
jgi:glutathione S-transferase